LSTTFGGSSRHREAKATVQYPAEVYDDEDITENGIIYRPHQVSFLRGWNFCSDLYRILEHVVESVDVGKPPPPGKPDSPVASLLARTVELPTSEILSTINCMYNKLPPELKQAETVTGNPQKDRHGFIGESMATTLRHDDFSC
jgi:hypothetical protein